MDDSDRDQGQHRHQHDQAGQLPLEPSSQREPQRRLRSAGRDPSADRAPALGVARVEAPAVELAEGARRPSLAQPGGVPGDRAHGASTSSTTSSRGALRAQTHAAAEPRMSASSVRKSSTSGHQRLEKTACATFAAEFGLPRPLSPPFGPLKPKSPPVNPKPPPGNPPALPVLASA